MTEPANVTSEGGDAAVGGSDTTETQPTGDSTSAIVENGGAGEGADADLVPEH